jgi:hypothetical protein
VKRRGLMLLRKAHQKKTEQGCVFWAKTDCGVPIPIVDCEAEILAELHAGFVFHFSVMMRR